MNILETITERTRERIRDQEKRIPLVAMRHMAEAVMHDEKRENAFAFERALRRPGMSFICEVKKASPSKGIIDEEFCYSDIAKDYEEAGAAAISCLTEPFWFLGTDMYLEEIAQQVSVPVLRKDFTCSEYMVYQAKALGASAVLLICPVLSDSELKNFRCLAEELQMSALVETHDAGEIERAKRAGASIIGVNNRNLKDFTVDIGHSIKLREFAGEDTVFVSESGIKSPEDMRQLYENETDAVLIGEMLIRAPDRKKMLKNLIGQDPFRQRQKERQCEK